MTASWADRRPARRGEQDTRPPRCGPGNVLTLRSTRAAIGVHGGFHLANAIADRSGPVRGLVVGTLAIAHTAVAHTAAGLAFLRRLPHREVVLDR